MRDRQSVFIHSGARPVTGRRCCRIDHRKHGRQRRIQNCVSCDFLCLLCDPWSKKRASALGAGLQTSPIDDRKVSPQRQEAPISNVRSVQAVPSGTIIIVRRAQCQTHLKICGNIRIPVEGGTPTTKTASRRGELFPVNDTTRCLLSRLDLRTHHVQRDPPRTNNTRSAASLVPGEQAKLFPCPQIRFLRCRGQSRHQLLNPKTDTSHRVRRECARCTDEHRAAAATHSMTFEMDRHQMPTADGQTVSRWVGHASAMTPTRSNSVLLAPLDGEFIFSIR